VRNPAKTVSSGSALQRDHTYLRVRLYAFASTVCLQTSAQHRILGPIRDDKALDMVFADTS